MKILNYKSIAKGSIVASFDLELPKMGIKICNMTLFQKDGRKWVNFPSRQYEAEGVKKYASYIYFLNKEHSEPFCKAVLDAIGALAIEQAEDKFQEPEDEELPF